MNRKNFLAAAAVATLAGVLGVSGAAAAGGGSDYPDHHGKRAVFVQTNKALGNTVQVYDRAKDGTLTKAGEYPTGGLGGFTLGAPVDALASQKSLVYDGGLLFAVNAGSNTITLFKVQGDRLAQRRVVASGGLTPVSIAVHDDLVYVLNAGGSGSVQGFRLHNGRLNAVDGANRPLGLANSNPPQFLTAPGQIGFDPTGKFLLVTTKGSDNRVLTFKVSPNGHLTERPTSNPAGAVPFGFTFDTKRTLLIAQAGTNSVTRFDLNASGSLTQNGPQVPNGQTASCWIQQVGDYFYVANAGSSTISAYRVNNGTPELVDPVAASTGGGSIDMTASGGFLYVQNAAAGTVEGYKVGADGSLTLVSTVSGLPQFDGTFGMEGIAAS